MFRSVILAVSLLVSGDALAGRGSMAQDVRVIRVSPSVSMYGTAREIRKQKTWEVREAIKHNNASDLEEQRSDNRRALEADKAYYKKLADQRKARGKK